MASGWSLLRMKVGLGGGRRPGLPAQVRPATVVPSADVGLGDQDVDGFELGDRRRRGGGWSGPAGEQRGDTAGGEGDDEHNDTRGFHTLHFPHDAVTDTGRNCRRRPDRYVVAHGFQQLNVNAWLMRRIQIELIDVARLRSVRACAQPMRRASGRRERGVSMRSADASSTACRDRPRAPRPRARCRRARRHPSGAGARPIPGRRAARGSGISAELDQQQRQRAAEERGVEQIVEQMIEAEPQRGRGRELGVAAADPAAREEAEGDDEHDGSRAGMRAACRRRSCRSSSASTKKPPTRISETRLEIVMVKRSLEAANAIIAGKQHQPDCVGDHVDSIGGSTAAGASRPAES